jgi:hypothetical protein
MGVHVSRGYNRAVMVRAAVHKFLSVAVAPSAQPGVPAGGSIAIELDAAVDEAAPGRVLQGLGR